MNQIKACDDCKQLARLGSSIGAGEGVIDFQGRRVEEVEFGFIDC